MAWEELVLVAPGLAETAGGGDADGERHWPTLRRWLARGDRQDGAQDVYAALTQHLGLTATDARLPSAALSRLGDFGDCPPGHWLAADPVHLAADLSDAVLVPGKEAGIDDLEARALIDTLNAHFRDDGLQFEWRAPSRWYLRLPSAPGITTTPLSVAAGRPVQAFLPAGPQATRWRRIMTESQMLLHAHQVNAAREADGRPTLNGIWLWGEGGLPQPPDPLWNLFGADPMIAGLSRLQVREPRGLPRAETVLASPQSPGSRALVWLRGGADPAWEAEWLAPLDRGLRNGLVRRLAVDPANGYVYRLTRWSRWRFWRRAGRARTRGARE